MLRVAEARALLELRPFGAFADEPWCLRAVERLEAYAVEARELLRGHRPGVGPIAAPNPERGGRGRLDLLSGRDLFVGRHEEIQQVTASLATQRMVTIVGPGGIGKTRLAVRLCDHLAPGFEHGVWFCDLSAVTADSSVAHAVASSLEISEHRDTTIIESIATTLAEEHLLMVLDNCEQVTDPVCTLVDEVLGPRSMRRHGYLTSSRSAV